MASTCLTYTNSPTLPIQNNNNNFGCPGLEQALQRPDHDLNQGDQRQRSLVLDPFRTNSHSKPRYQSPKSGEAQARDLPRIVQAAYHLVPYFMFSAQEGSRSALFAATDPQVPEYCELLKTDEWPVCAFLSQDCHPTNPSEEAHNTETSYQVWEKTFEMIGLPSDAVERLIEGEEVLCRYGADRG